MRKAGKGSLLSEGRGLVFAPVAQHKGLYHLRAYRSDSRVCQSLQCMYSEHEHPIRKQNYSNPRRIQKLCETLRFLHRGQ